MHSNPLGSFFLFTDSFFLPLKFLASLIALFGFFFHLLAKLQIYRLWTGGTEECPGPEYRCPTENDVSQVLSILRPSATCMLWSLMILHGK